MQQQIADQPTGHRVIHQPRVAWDLARALVTVAGADEGRYQWFAARIQTLLGPAYRGQLVGTRANLAAAVRDDVRQIEIGQWRTRLEDLLRTRPELTTDLSALGRDTVAALRG